MFFTFLFLFYTSKYFFIEIPLPNTPIPIPNPKYTIKIMSNISLNSSNVQLAISKNDVVAIQSAKSV